MDLSGAASGALRPALGKLVPHVSKLLPRVARSPLRRPRRMTHWRDGPAPLDRPSRRRAWRDPQDEGAFARRLGSIATTRHTQTVRVDLTFWRFDLCGDLPRANKGSSAARSLRARIRKLIDAVHRGPHITNQRMRGIRASETR